MFGCNFRGLRRARERTGHNQVGPRFDPFQKRRHFVHFLFTPLRERPLVIRFFPVRPIRLAMSKKIEVHLPILTFPLPLNLNLRSHGQSTRHFGRRVRGSVCQRRTPPRYALRLYPCSAPSGSTLSFLVLPPPRTT